MRALAKMNTAPKMYVHKYCTYGKDFVIMTRNVYAHNH